MVGEGGMWVGNCERVARPTILADVFLTKSYISWEFLERRARVAIPPSSMLAVMIVVCVLGILEVTFQACVGEDVFPPCLEP